MFLNFRLLTSAISLLATNLIFVHSTTFSDPLDVRSKRASVQTPKCGIRPSNVEQLRIVDGEDALPHSWPWMASILKEDADLGEFVHFCGGSLVARNKVLTAAHCFNKVKKDDLLKVRLGAYTRSEKAEGELELDVSRRDVHEGYVEKEKRNDIAMLTLERPVNYTEAISPICMSLKGQMQVNSTCYVTGWGHTQFLGTLSDYLQQLKLPILDDSICPNVTTNFNVTTQFCAGYLEGGKDSCQGDSGGPVACQDHEGDPWRLHGIVSFGSQCARKGNAAVYTRVSAYKRWIADHINK